MTRRVRWVVLTLGLAGTAVVLALAFRDMPSFGSSHHPYWDATVPASVAHGSANVVASINFDQRGIDTLGEELIFFASVLAVAVLLRPADDEELRPEPGSYAPLQSTRLFGYLLLPVALLVGADIVTHGTVTPGGGFQGGIMLATAIHLLYVAGRYRSLERLRPMPLLEYTEAAAVAAFVALGFAGVAVTGEFLANVIPFGTFGQAVSAGTVFVLNVAVGLAVGAGGILMLAKFFDQVFLVQKDPSSKGPDS